MIAISMTFPDSFGSGLVGEGHACLGVDIQATSGAPDEELIRVDYGVDHLDAAPLGVALQIIGFFAPSLIGRGEPIAISHDLQNARVILSRVPRNSDCIDPLAHGAPSLYGAKPTAPLKPEAAE